jgi:hypothetical protein
MSPEQQEDQELLIQWLKDVRQGPGYFCVGVPSKWHQYYFKTDEELLKLIEKYRATNSIYVSMASYPEKSARRTQSEASELCSFWMDLDCHGGGKYNNADEAYEDVISFIEYAGYPYPSYVHYSGYGVHVFWATDKKFESDEWEGHAYRLRIVAELYGLDLDGEVTTDSARVLRIPFSKNFRDPENPIDTQLYELNGRWYD